MSSPGQRRGSCGHVMALCDLHTKCVRCREKGIGGDDCVLKNPAPFVRSLQKIRRHSWPPLSIKHVKNLARRKVTLPPTLLHLMSLYWVRLRGRVKAPVIEVKLLQRKLKRPLTSLPLRRNPASLQIYNQNYKL